MAPATEIRRRLYAADALRVAETVAVETNLTLLELLGDTDREALELLWYRLRGAGLSSKQLVQIFRCRIEPIQAAIRKHREANAAPVTHTLMVDGYPCEIEEASRAS